MTTIRQARIDITTPRLLLFLMSLAALVSASCADASLPVEPRLAAALVRVDGDRPALILQQAEQQIGVVIAQVQVLCDAGGLKAGHCTALRATIEGALRSAQSGNVAAAVGQIGAFINQVVAFGRAEFLNAVEVQAIIIEAGRAIATLRS
jgi:ABC-type amino acid transport substrate-binding protein